MNMFAKNAATSVEEYLTNIPEDRKVGFLFLHDFIQKTVPNLMSHFATNMIGYGSFQYLDAKKQKREWPIISLANQKNYFTIYLCSTLGDQYVAEKYASVFGQVSVGRSCVKIKHVKDLNLETLTTVLKICEKHPGLLGATVV